MKKIAFLSFTVIMSGLLFSACDTSISGEVQNNITGQVADYTGGAGKLHEASDGYIFIANLDNSQPIGSISADGNLEVMLPNNPATFTLKDAFTKSEQVCKSFEWNIETSDSEARFHQINYLENRNSNRSTSGLAQTNGKGRIVPGFKMALRVFADRNVVISGSMSCDFGLSKPFANELELSLQPGWNTVIWTMESISNAFNTSLQTKSARDLKWSLYEGGLD